MDILRKIVSGKRRRLCNDKFDLDITFITPKVAGMSFPATGMEKMYRNNINDVIKTSLISIGSSFPRREALRQIPHLQLQ
jgi:phosphatidylinositol-3,4,5-trisphosphate 3-phosphatase/dual-specificity protein phosphatase PTEN